MTEYIEHIVIETPDGELEVEAKLPEHIEGTGHAGRKRSLVKTLTWRCIATTDTIIITRLVTGSWTAGAIVGGAEVFTKMFLYYLHERGWSASDWGLEDVDVDEKALKLRPVH